MDYLKKCFSRSDRQGRAVSDPLGRLGRHVRGPQLGISTLIIVVALYFTLFLNKRAGRESLRARPDLR